MCVRVIRYQQFSQEKRESVRIDGRRVEGDDQHMIGGLDSQELRKQRALASKIDGVAQTSREPLLCLGIVLHSHDRQIVVRWGLCNALRKAPTAVDEAHAQAVVPSYDEVERITECRGRELSFEANAGIDVA